MNVNGGLTVCSASHRAQAAEMGSARKLGPEERKIGEGNWSPRWSGHRKQRHPFRDASAGQNEDAEPPFKLR